MCQHSPSSCTKAQEACEDLDFVTHEQLGQDVRDHLARRTVLQHHMSRGDHIPNEMVPDVDMFRAGVQHTALGYSDRALVVRQ